ncbi:MAG: hypothetical protein KKB93_14595 [Actinobacteria bacterium]|nr:hypothetical protein [Actinomycetota bacterium]
MKIEYTKSKNYVTCPITGVVGGLSPTGFVQCEIFTETAKITSDHELVINESGIPMQPEMHIKTFNRELQALLLLTPEVAKNIGKWLIQMSEQAELATK